MRRLTKAALLCCGVSMLAMGLTAAGPRHAVAQAAEYRFDIPAKPLLAALADYTAVTGIQVVRPSAERLTGRSRPLSGTHSAESALHGLLAGSNLVYEFTGPRTVTVRNAAGEEATFVPDGGEVLPEIVVSGSGIARGGVSEINVTAEDLERKNPSDVKDIFAGEPGIQVGSSLPMSQKVYVHGIEETSLAVTIDGSRQNNKVFHHNATTLIDPGLLKAVRVDAGVAPADAGPGALGGAIAYETKDARDLLLDGRSIGGFVKGTFNSNGNVFSTNLAGYGAAPNGLEFLGYFTFAKGDEFKDGDGRMVEGTRADLIGGIGKVAYETDSGYRVSLSHERLLDDAERPFRANAGFIDTGRAWEPRVRDYRLERRNTVFTFADTSPEGWWNPKVVLAHSDTSIGTRVYLRPPSPSYPITGETGSLNGKVENLFVFGLGSVTAGVDFYRDRAKLADLNAPAREKAGNTGVYVQARLEPSDRVRLSFGGRGDRQVFTGTGGQEWTHSGLSANLSAELDIVADILTAKAGYAHVWAGVPLAENFIMNPVWVYGGGPRPVTADNFTAGLVARHSGFSVEGGVFRTAIENARTPRWAIGTPAALGAIANRDVVSEGYEVGVGYEWASGFIRAKYANIDVTVDGAPVNSDLGNYLATPVGELITLTAAHTFASWGLTIGGDIEIAPEYDRVAPGTPSYKPYEIVNVFAEYRPPQLSNLTFRAEVSNLFDETYSDRATYGQEFGNVTPLREPGRSFVLSAAAKF